MTDYPKLRALAGRHLIPGKTWKSDSDDLARALLAALDFIENQCLSVDEAQDRLDTLEEECDA